MGCLKIGWWMYYRRRRSWSAGLIQAYSPLAQKPKCVGWQKVESDFTAAVLLLNLQDLGYFWPPWTSTASRWLAFGWYFSCEIPFTCVCWRHAKGYPRRAAFGEAGSSCRCPCREDNCNWSSMKHPIHLTQCQQNVYILPHYQGHTRVVGSPFFLPNGGWIFSRDFLGRGKRKYLVV